MIYEIITLILRFFHQDLTLQQRNEINHLLIKFKSAIQIYPTGSELLG